MTAVSHNVLEAERGAAAVVVELAVLDDQREGRLLQRQLLVRRRPEVPRASRSGSGSWL